MDDVAQQIKNVGGQLQQCMICVLRGIEFSLPSFLAIRSVRIYGSRGGETSGIPW